MRKLKKKKMGINNNRDAKLIRNRPMNELSGKECKYFVYELNYKVQNYLLFAKDAYDLGISLILNLEPKTDSKVDSGLLHRAELPVVNVFQSYFERPKPLSKTFTSVGHRSAVIEAERFSRVACSGCKAALVNCTQ